jgi:hypothetical protein
VRLIFITTLALTGMGSLVAADGHLNAAIGPPKLALYRSIRDARDWRNPILTVQDDGVLIRANGVREPTHVSIEDVKGFLISLPVSVRGLTAASSLNRTKAFCRCLWKSTFEKCRRSGNGSPSF